MKWKYDPKGMKNCASNLEKELKEYEKAMNNMNSNIDTLSSSWDDSTQRNFCNFYNKEVRDSAKHLDDKMKEIKDFLVECARRFSNAKDEGGSNMGR